MPNTWNQSGTTWGNTGRWGDDPSTVGWGQNSWNTGLMGSN